LSSPELYEASYHPQISERHWQRRSRDTKFRSLRECRISHRRLIRGAGCRDTNRLFRRWYALSGFPGGEPYDEVPDKRFCRQVYERRMKKSFGPRIPFAFGWHIASKVNRIGIDLWLTEVFVPVSPLGVPYHHLSGVRWCIPLILEVCLTKIYLITCYEQVYM